MPSQRWTYTNNNLKSASTGLCLGAMSHWLWPQPMVSLLRCGTSATNVTMRANRTLRSASDYGCFGVSAVQGPPSSMWRKPTANGKTAVLAINSAALPHTITINVSEMFIPNSSHADSATEAFAVDIWSGAFLGKVKSISRVVRPHSNLFVTLSTTPPTFRVPSFLSDNMVLQRGNATMWGWSTPGSVVTLRVTTPLGELLGDANVTTTAKGVWRVSLSQPAHSTPTTISITTPDHPAITIKNVLWGDVILCSGQSNMKYPVADAFNGTSERAHGSFYPSLRMLNIADTQADTPASDAPSDAHEYIWAASSPSTIAPARTGDFGNAFPSAACWFAARELVRRDPQTPVGMITAARSGSTIQSWMPGPMIFDGQSPALGGNGTCGGTLGDGEISSWSGGTGAASQSPEAPKPAVSVCVCVCVCVC